MLTMEAKIQTLEMEETIHLGLRFSAPEGRDFSADYAKERNLENQDSRPNLQGKGQTTLSETNFSMENIVKLGENSQRIPTYTLFNLGINA